MTTSTLTESRPALWNPNAAASWSLLLSPAFGAYLHARNADCLGRTEEARGNKVWFRLTLCYHGFVLLSAFTPSISAGFFKGAGLVILLGWYCTEGIKQINHVDEKWAMSYERKSWTLPLLIAFGCLVGFLAVAIVLGIVAERVLD